MYMGPYLTCSFGVLEQIESMIKGTVHQFNIRGGGGVNVNVISLDIRRGLLFTFVSLQFRP